MTASHGGIRLQGILSRQVGGVALGQSAYGTAEEIAIVDDIIVIVVGVHRHRHRHIVATIKI